MPGLTEIEAGMERGANQDGNFYCMTERTASITASGASDGMS